MASLVFPSCVLWLLNFADVFARADKVDQMNGQMPKKAIMFINVH